MNIKQIRSAIKHLVKTSNCMHCKSEFSMDDVNIVATTKAEGLFEMKCPQCKAGTIATVVLTPKNPSQDDFEVSEAIPDTDIEITEHSGPRVHQSISPNDILDVKNSLNNFDGNFKKLFKQE